MWPHCRPDCMCRLHGLQNASAQSSPDQQASHNNTSSSTAGCLGRQAGAGARPGLRGRREELVNASKLGGREAARVRVVEQLCHLHRAC